MTIKGITQEDVDNALSQMGEDVSPQVKDCVQKAVRAFAEEGKLPAEALNISEQEIEPLYAYTYRLFQSGKYEKAASSFHFLVILDPSYRHFFGLAASYQYLGEPLKAIAYYIVCTELEPLNPIPHFHLYGCYRSLQHYLPAYDELETTIALANRDPTYALLKQRAELERDGLKQAMKEKYDKKGV